MDTALLLARGSFSVFLGGSEPEQLGFRERQVIVRSESVKGLV